MQATSEFIKKELANLYPENELSGFITLIFSSICGLSFTDQVIKKEYKVSKIQLLEIEKTVKRLKNYEPIQYVLGETEFFGLTFQVNPSVLIPRPETEELVDWILKSEIKNSSEIIDIGTGSGCIAIALKKNLPACLVSAVDVSSEAIHTAMINAKQNTTDILFIEQNILEWEAHQWEKYDVVVSNPPYVRELEKKFMSQNVLGYEPNLALFVADSNPLLFYETIIRFSVSNLNKGGWVFFEINEIFGEQICQLFEKFHFSEIELRKDINGKNRMIKAIKN